MVEFPVAAREIAPDVHWLGLKGRTRTNVYLIGSGSSWALIDAGWEKDGPAIMRAAETTFGAGARPAAILLTHVHPDHDGSALELARAWGLSRLRPPGRAATGLRSRPSRQRRGRSTPG